ncbi:MAG: prepilin peptidase [Pirellulaceae bacterium]|nr:prepilin peptidase [Pirellulaceae bacterium]
MLDLELLAYLKDIILLLWLTAFGGFVGSFLNVVIFRMPNGQSLSIPGSHCYYCGVPIRWFDNIPVFSWLFLGAKCRHCLGPISIRYPMVELSFAIVSFLLALREIFSKHSLAVLEKLSRYYPHDHWLFVEVFEIPAAGWVRYSAYFLLFCLLGSITAIGYDRKKVPLRLPVIGEFLGLLLVLFAPVLWIDLGPNSWWDRLVLADSSLWGGVSYLNSMGERFLLLLLYSASMVVIGGSLSWVVYRSSTHFYRRSWWALAAQYELLGIYLGWPRMIALLAYSTPPLILLVIFAKVRKKEVPEYLWSLLLFFTAIIVFLGIG